MLTIPASSATDRSGFADLRVVELGSWLAAPNACALFADLGAEVIKVEAKEGDPLRFFPSSMSGGTEESAAFGLLNRGKKSVILDVAAVEGREALEALLDTADVLVTNLRIGALEKLKLDPGTISARHPRLVYASLTGQGLAGPDRNLPGFDSGAFWARSGMLNQVTAEGAEPLGLLGGYGDLMTSLAMFSAILVGLRQRDATGRGGLVEASLLRTGAWILSGDIVAQASMGRAPRPRPRSRVKTPLVNSYRTSDDRWFFLTAVEAGRHFASVARAIGRPELAEDARFKGAKAIRENARELIDLLEEAFAQRSLQDWSEAFKAHGVWWERMASPAEVMSDPQVLANHMASQIAWKDGPITVVTAPFQVFGRFSDAPVTAPGLGEHNDEILTRGVGRKSERARS